MRSIEEILAEVDQLFEENETAAVEQLLTESLQEANACGDDSSKLHILNEMIGYYRQLSQKAKMLAVIDEALETVEKLDVKGTVPYATTKLNAANGYRSIGELEKSAEFYAEAEEIYLRSLSENDMLLANLFNNMSLLFQEQLNYERAEEYLLKALTIVSTNQAGFEIAVTYANLANTAVLAKEYEKARDYANQAITRFEERGTIDPHYCAALSALGLYYYSANDLDKAVDIFERAMDIVEKTVGHNSQYERLKENRDMCKGIHVGNGLELCEKYYEAYGRPMIEEKFPEYKDKIAVGLVGEGSDCFGFDDKISRDHDWGPGFVMWVSKETYQAIGKQLQQAYDELPDEYMGCKRSRVVQGKNRRGVIEISEFYANLIGTATYEDIDWKKVPDYALAAATNGKVFVDMEGTFSELRNQLLKGYPEHIRYLMIAEEVAKLSQTGQYNYARMLERGDGITADLMLAECIEHILRLQHLIMNVYPPHKKWLYKSCNKIVDNSGLMELVKELHRYMGEFYADYASKNVVVILENIGDYFARQLYALDYISDINPYLDYHTEELLKKSMYALVSDEELVERIAKLEFKAFDQVKNEGGRASCQNDWPTFSVMRKSQYLTWNRNMLMQYLYDFSREFEQGHNLITEKYGRMMESTAPDKYAEIENHFPALSEQKKAIIEQIVAIQMEMVEEFGEEHPKVVGNARSLHTYEDNIVNTSYETYLRGEISTYSDKMLQLYAKHVITCAQEGVNIARKTIENTARLYGYPDLATFESKIK